MCLSKVVASATAEKYFTKKSEKCGGNAINETEKMGDKGAPQTNLNSREIIQ